jgi:Icc protein
MRRELNRPPFTVGGTVDLGPWRIVLLDSSLAGSARGRLSDETLQQLETALRSAAGRHCLVSLHHHPVPMSSRWLDQVGLENAADFFAIIDRHRAVRAIVWGHVHQAYDSLRHGVRLLGTPSTCAQFLPHADEFAVDRRPPAYRTFELRSDGSLFTEVVWVEQCASGSSSHSASSAA